MRHVLPVFVFCVTAIVGTTHAQHPTSDFTGDLSTLPVTTSWHARSPDLDAFELAMPIFDERWLKDPVASNLQGYTIRGQDDDGASGDGAGAASAVDPSVPLTQLRFQNVFVPSTYDASGYANEVRLQPVLPIHLNSEFFPYHIVRPTLPIFAPTANPDGPLGVQGGLGDLTLLDLYAHPIEHLKTNVGIGYVSVLPTATHAQLGLREWQLGPAAFMVSTAVPKWVIGAIYQQPFSVESDAFSVQVQPIATRLLPNEWYVGVSDFLWILDNQSDEYNLPLSLRVGKVVTVGEQPLNISVSSFYTPKGLRSGPASEWGVKVDVTFLFPKTKLGPLFGSKCDCDCRQ